MKQDIHPEYTESTVTCSCGNTFVTRSVKADLHVELCNMCHPFYTGKQKLVDTGGRVERFQKKYAKSRPAAKPQAQPAEAAAVEAPAEAAAVEAPAEAAAVEEPAAEPATEA